LASYPAVDLRWEIAAAVPDLQEQIHATIADLEPLAIHDHESADGWRIFFRTSAQRDAAAAALRALRGSRLVYVEPIDIEDDGWARRSQANLKAVRINRVVVAPPWDVVDSTTAAANDVIVVIDPSTGFGTGHHETTRLCIGLLQEIDLRGLRVVDVGTGSGVLAIAAAKLGASAVVAIDEDPEALRNALENIERNGVAGTIRLVQADVGASSADEDQQADVVLANLTGAVLQRHADRLAAFATPGGRLVVSGFGPDELGDVLAAFQADAVRHAIEGEWAAAALMVARRPRTQS
jgi:ribosomal protein L11 methyltransferase